MQSENMEEELVIKEEPEEVEDPLSHPSAMVIENEGRVVFQCPECDRQFDTDKAFTFHAKTHEVIKNGRFQCEYCSKCCLSKPFLRSHLWKAHKIIVDLDKRKKRAYNIKDKNTSYCEICDKTFLSAHNYKCHMRRHRDLESGKYTCDFCQKSYGTWSELNRHIKMHPPMGVCGPSEIPLYCKNCNKHYASDQTFNRHLRYSMKKGQQIKQLKTHAEKEAAKEKSGVVEDPLEPTHPSAIVIKQEGGTVYQCPECDRQFATNRAFSSHTEKHENVKSGKFQCEHCTKCCLSEAFLRSHLWKAHKIVLELDSPEKKTDTETNISSYCESCDKTFLSADSYKAHMRRHRHLEAGKYTCEICQKSYGTWSELNRHIKMHPPMGVCGLSEIPNYCKNCNKHFSSDVLFKRHLRYFKSKGQQIKPLKTHADKEASKQNASVEVDHDYAVQCDALDPSLLVQIKLENEDE